MYNLYSGMKKKKTKTVKVKGMNSKTASGGANSYKKWVEHGMKILNKKGSY